MHTILLGWRSMTWRGAPAGDSTTGTRTVALYHARMLVSVGVLRGRLLSYPRGRRGCAAKLAGLRWKVSWRARATRLSRPASRAAVSKGQGGFSRRCAAASVRRAVRLPAEQLEPPRP